jgi:hypothetical protein
MQVVLPRDLRSGLAGFSKSAAACAMYDHHQRKIQLDRAQAEANHGAVPGMHEDVNQYV